jgi:hypothetical protein
MSLIPLPLAAGSLWTRQRPALAQAAIELLAQRPSALDEQRHVDALDPLRPPGIADAEVGALKKLARGTSGRRRFRPRAGAVRCMM